MNTTQKKLFSMSKGKQREEAIKSGFYDGRFRTKTEVSKRHKSPKYKHKLFESC